MKINLKRVKKGDEKVFADYMNDPYILKEECFYKKTFNVKDAKEQIDKAVKNKEFLFLIFFEDLAVGAIGLKSPKGKNKIYEVGYTIKKEYSGKGIATEALKEVCKLGFNELKLVRIWAKVLPNNKASMRVLEKAGFKREGYLRKSFYLNGKYNDEVVYGKVR